MRSIPHRELRNNSSRILDDVSKGEAIEVTNHGKTVAVLMPPSTTPYDRLVASGGLRVADDSRRVDLRRIARRPPAASTLQILDDVRGER